jgi:hypothetical protein
MLTLVSLALHGDKESFKELAGIAFAILTAFFFRWLIFRKRS